MNAATQITTPQSNHTSIYQQAVNIAPVHTTIPVSQPLQPLGVNIPSYYQPPTQFTNINYQPVKFTGTSSTMQGISSTNYPSSTIPSTNFQYVPSQQISTTYVSSNQPLMGQNIGTPSQLSSQGINTQFYSNYQVGSVTVNGND